jgi:endonuclease/exonuclease/phosphatase family metal-dependent hydrolase
MKKILILLFPILNLIFTQDFDELYFGTDDALDIMTWNIEWFPKNDGITVDYVSQIIDGLDMDVLAIQEVDDAFLFTQMVDQLIQYDSYLESTWFAGLAYIYNSETVEINDIYEIYTSSPYWSPFPRSPMVMDMNFMGENYIIINNHFKCCGDNYLNDNDDGDEETRRYIASTLLKEYIDNNFSTKNVIVLGDLNDILTDNITNNVFQMIIEDSENYLFVDMAIAAGSSAEWSYPSWPSHLDHILITNELFDNNSYVEVIRIDDFMDGGFSQFDQNISDHRPVGIKLSTETVLLGDMNFDGEINVVDIVSIIAIILDSNSEYDLLADLNEDNVINIIDIVQLVNMILD